MTRVYTPKPEPCTRCGHETGCLLQTPAGELLCLACEAIAPMTDEEEAS